MATIKRSELYELVWSKPMVKLAREFGMSDVGLAKVCRRSSIPTPGVGYWAKVEAGQKVHRKPLPRPYIGGTVRMRDPLTLNPALQADMERHLEDVLNGNKIVVRETLRGAHPLVARTSKLLGSRTGERLRDWDSVPEGCLDVSVARSSFRRAMLVMDAVVKFFESRGWPVVVLASGSTGKTYYETSVSLLGSSVEFSMVGDSMLSLQLDSRRTCRSAGAGLRRTWADGKIQRVENCLNQFVAGVIRMAACQHEARLEREREDREHEEEERRRRAEEEARAAMWAKIQEEKSRVERLQQGAEDWATSNRIRSYVSARLAALGPSEELAKWARWANAQADRIDPLRDSPASITDDEEKYRPRQRGAFGWG